MEFIYLLFLIWWIILSSLSNFMSTVSQSSRKSWLACPYDISHPRVINSIKPSWPINLSPNRNYLLFFGTLSSMTATIGWWSEPTIPKYYVNEHGNKICYSLFDNVLSNLHHIICFPFLHRHDIILPKAAKSIRPQFLIILLKGIKVHGFS